MHAAQYAALLHDIAERGVLTPIDLDEQGHILDGHHRIRACGELGVVDLPVFVRSGLSEHEERTLPGRSIRCAGTSHAPGNAP